MLLSSALDSTMTTGNNKAQVKSEKEIGKTKRKANSLVRDSHTRTECFQRKAAGRNLKSSVVTAATEALLCPPRRGAFEHLTVSCHDLRCA